MCPQQLRSGDRCDWKHGTPDQIKKGTQEIVGAMVALSRPRYWQSQALLAFISRPSSPHPHYSRSVLKSLTVDTYLGLVLQ